MPAKVRANVVGGEFLVSLNGLCRELGCGPGLPLVEEFGERRFRRIDILAFVGCGLQSDEFGLGLALRALDAVISGDPPASRRVGPEIKLEFPATLPAPADVAGH